MVESGKLIINKKCPEGLASHLLLMSEMMTAISATEESLFISVMSFHLNDQDNQDIILNIVYDSVMSRDTGGADGVILIA